MEVSGDCSVTAVDVADHPVVGGIAEGHGELTGLALWLMAERAQVRGGRMAAQGSLCWQCLGYRMLDLGSYEVKS